MDLTELRRTISLCKEGINNADQNLIKLTGRNYDKNNENLSNNQRFLNKRRINVELEIPNEIKKPRNDKDVPLLNSVVQMTKGRTRDDALSELKKKENPKEKERCKRLFSHMMGTLNSIVKDAEKSTNDPQNITRLKIEKKVEEGNKLINETIQKEHSELLRSKRERQNDLKILNQRYRAAEAFDRWRSEKEKMKGFIRTTKTPFIFYRPKVINDEAQLRIDQTSREIDTVIETRKKKLEMEILKAVKYSELHMIGRSHHDNNNNDGDMIMGEGVVGAGAGPLIKMIDDDKFLDLEMRSGKGITTNSSNHHHSNILMGGSVTGDFEMKRSQQPFHRSHSPVDSLASEDYEDMIEEIEISMHEEDQQQHDRGNISVIVGVDAPAVCNEGNNTMAGSNSRVDEGNEMEMKGVESCGYVGSAENNNVEMKDEDQIEKKEQTLTIDVIDNVVGVDTEISMEAVQDQVQIEPMDEIVTLPPTEQSHDDEEIEKSIDDIDSNRTVAKDAPEIE